MAVTSSTQETRTSTCRRSSTRSSCATDDVLKGIQTDLDEKGIAKTARDEKRLMRDGKLMKTPEDERMEKLYREQIMNEKPEAEPKTPIVQIQV